MKYKLKIIHLELKRGASRWSSALYCPMRNSDQMTIRETHSTLSQFAECAISIFFSVNQLDNFSLKYQNSNGPETFSAFENFGKISSFNAVEKDDPLTDNAIFDHSSNEIIIFKTYNSITLTVPKSAVSLYHRLCFLMTEFNHDFEAIIWIDKVVRVTSFVAEVERVFQNCTNVRHLEHHWTIEREEALNWISWRVGPPEIWKLCIIEVYLVLTERFILNPLEWFWLWIWHYYYK